jgi:hypothetical protein
VSPGSSEEENEVTIIIPDFRPFVKLATEHEKRGCNRSNPVRSSGEMKKGEMVRKDEENS